MLVKHAGRCTRDLCALRRFWRGVIAVMACEPALHDDWVQQAVEAAIDPIEGELARRLRLRDGASAALYAGELLAATPEGLRPIAVLQPEDLDAVYRPEGDCTAGEADRTRRVIRGTFSINGVDFDAEISEPDVAAAVGLESIAPEDDADQRRYEGQFWDEG